MNLYELNAVRHIYNSRTVLALDQWRMPRGIIQGLAGPNGSGKTTLLRLLGFVEKPSQGQILFNGRPADPFSQNVRSKVVLLPQESYLLKRSVYANIAYGLNIRKDQDNRSQRIHQALEWVGLSPSAFAQRPWFALSGGEARRAALAARLVLKPEVLLLDEPTSSVDDASTHLIKEAVMLAHRQWGTTLIIASHDMPWLQDICDHVCHLFRGSPAGSGQTTFIFGPWQRNTDHSVTKTLSDDQRFTAAPAPTDLESAVASIEARYLLLIQPKDETPPGATRLCGTLTRLGYEKRTGRLHARVSVGTIDFSIYVTPEQLWQKNYIPGQTVCIVYNPRDITWHT